MNAKRFSRSVGYALRGLAYGIRVEKHFRVHLIIAVLVIGCGVWLGIGIQQWTVISLCIALVLVSELVNTAVERVVDLATTEYHPLAEAAKNVAAGAVLLAALGAVVCGVLILGPPLWLVMKQVFR
ncbi:MAG: diacylglycerol kinase family protein [Firmicutes bacterium]|nr:diacylglycerol kinase family protein [Bacillota bacterium]